MNIESLEEQRKIYGNSPFNNHLGIKDAGGRMLAKSIGTFKIIR
ncbi:hypothetical protein [Peribacillus faecalis]|nr:hypothetical protein [Peribacillus faecalis]